MKFFIILLFLFILNCSTNKVTNNHGYTSLNLKFDKITINQSNKNDILNNIGPPSSISNFDKNKWFYVQRIKKNQSIFKLGIKKIDKNNILVLQFDNKGILQDKIILDVSNMNDIKYTKQITEKEFKQNNVLFNILSSIREKANAPSKNRSKNK